MLMSKIILSTSEIAKFFEVSRQAIAKWSKAGCPQEKRGQWDLKIVHDWWFNNIAQSKMPDDETLAEAKRKYWNAKAQSEDLKSRQLSEKLVEWDQVGIEWARRAAEYKAGCFELENSLPPIIEGKDQAAMRKDIYDQVWKIFDRVTRTGRFCPTVKQKK